MSSAPSASTDLTAHLRCGSSGFLASQIDSGHDWCEEPNRMDVAILIEFAICVYGHWAVAKIAFKLIAWSDSTYVDQYDIVFDRTELTVAYYDMIQLTQITCRIRVCHVVVRRQLRRKFV